MLTIVFLSLWLQTTGVSGAGLCLEQGSLSAKAGCNAAGAYEAAPQNAASARCADLFESPDERVTPSLHIAPGAPPLLSFRGFEGKMRQRFSHADLMLDDAGH